MKRAKEKEKFKAFRIIKNIFLVLLIVILTGVLIITMYSRLTGGAPSLFGYSMYRVSSGSMEPELKVGDVILMRECDGDSVEVNDIVTYFATSGQMQGNMVTHRVVKAPYQEDGKTYIVTKGDANFSNDEPIEVGQIEGVLITKLAFLKIVFDIFVTPWGLLILIALIILAFFNEIVIFVKTVLGIGYEPKHQESVDDIIKRIQKVDSKNKTTDSTDITDEEG